MRRHPARPKCDGGDATPELNLKRPSHDHRGAVRNGFGDRLAVESGLLASPASSTDIISLVVVEQSGPEDGQVAGVEE